MYATTETMKMGLSRMEKSKALLLDKMRKAEEHLGSARYDSMRSI